MKKSKEILRELQNMNSGFTTDDLMLELNKELEYMKKEVELSARRQIRKEKIEKLNDIGRNRK